MQSKKILASSLLITLTIVIASSGQELNPAEFQFRMLEPERRPFTLEMINNRNEILRWQCEVDTVSGPDSILPARHDGGELLGTFRWGEVGANELKPVIMPIWWENDNLLVISNDRPIRCATLEVDRNYRVIRQWQQPEFAIRAMGKHIEGAAALIDGQNYILPMWIAGGNIRNINNTQWIIDGLQPLAIAGSISNECLFTLDANEAIVVIRWGRVVGRIRNYEDFTEGAPISNILWVDEHPGGELWCSDGDRLWQMEVDIEQMQVTGLVQTFAIPEVRNSNPRDGICHDGRNLIIGSFDQEGYSIVDDGWHEGYWLQVANNEGEINHGEAQDIDCYIDPGERPDGIYQAMISFVTNMGNLSAPITLIFGAVPMIEARWSQTAGFPRRVNFNSEFFDIFVGYRYQIPIFLTNTGSGDLVIESFDFNGIYYSVDAGQMSIQPDSTETVMIEFFADEDGESVDTVTIISNNWEAEELTIGLFADALWPPAIIVDPGGGFELENPQPGDELSLLIDNIGGSDLRWRSTVEYLGEDEEEWISVTPDSNSVPAGARDEAVISFARRQPGNGQEAVDLHILSNDPEYQDVVIPLLINWVGVEEENQELLPSSITISSVYPNPFNSNTIIAFNLPKRAEVQLGLYDLKGNQILKTKADLFDRGVNHLVVDAGRLPAGIYWAKLETGTEAKTVKLALLR